MGKAWSEEEQILALNLYFKLPFGQQHSNNGQIQKLAERLGRTPGSINMKLNNYAALDDTLDREGLSNTSNKDEEIWDRYWENLNELGTVSEFLLGELEEEATNPENDQMEIEELLSKKRESFGTEQRTDQKRRVGQQFFRRVVLSNYEYQCCVCRLKQKPLLEAAHIVKWSETDDPNQRINPRNGMAMCRIHHKAFDEDIIKIEPDKKIILLSKSVEEEKSPGAKSMFRQFENEAIFHPEKFGPDKKLLEKSDRR